MPGQALKSVAVRTLFGPRLGCGRLQERRARGDARVADESRITGDHVFDAAGRLVTELATAFGYEMLSHWSLPSARRP